MFDNVQISLASFPLNRNTPLRGTAKIKVDFAPPEKKHANSLQDKKNIKLCELSNIKFMCADTFFGQITLLLKKISLILRKTQ